VQIHWFVHGDVAETALRAIGVALAGGSVVFAAHTTGANSGQPQIHGAEHFAIYARQKSGGARKPERLDIDNTAASGVQRAATTVFRDDYEIVEAAAPSARIRSPQGRIMTVAPGMKYPVLGKVLSISERNGKWSVAADYGVIRQR